MKVELDWLKKILALSIEQKRGAIDFMNDQISVSRQCELLILARSTLYYKHRGLDPFNRNLMREIDEQYTESPFYGSRRITACLKQKGYKVNRKRIQRLMRLMGIQTIYPGPNLSKPCGMHKTYLHLFNNVNVWRMNQVRSTDITYIRLSGGFIYLMAIIDWYSRLVLAWEVPITLKKKNITIYSHPLMHNVNKERNYHYYYI